jgi:hypothetical protein
MIDAKLLADTINKAIQDGTFTSKSIWEWISDAPTILEAESECDSCKHQGDEYWCRDAYTNSDGNCSLYEPMRAEEE